MDTRATLGAPEGTAPIRRVMQGAATVAAANGYLLGESDIEGTLRGTAEIPAYKTSMAADF